jgi:hypothetical protein
LSGPGNAETIMKYCHFERRRNPDDLSKAISILTSALESDTLDEKSKPYIFVQYAKMIWHVSHFIVTLYNIMYK